MNRYLNLKLFILGIMLFSLTRLIGQNQSDSSEAVFFIRFDYAHFLAAGDFEKRYSNTNSVGGAFGYKTASNFTFNFSAGANFSRDVKSDGLLSDIINSVGDATDEDGELVKLTYEQRGLNLFLSGAKVFNLLSANANSGLVTEFGIGYFQHRIKVDYRDGEVFQLSDEMLKGYDRLHTGLAIRQFVGYQYFGPKNLLNFYLGLEFQQAFTVNRRCFNYDTKEFDTSQKKDLLYGLRFGWIIPIKKRSSEEFYYY